jgi:hypothetical protein
VIIFLNSSETHYEERNRFIQIMSGTDDRGGSYVPLEYFALLKFNYYLHGDWLSCLLYYPVITLHAQQLFLKHSYLESRATYKYLLVNSDKGHNDLNQIALRGSILLILKLATIYLCTCNHQSAETSYLRLQRVALRSVLSRINL